MKKIDEIIRSMLWFWTGLCTGWFIFGGADFWRTLGYLVLGMIIIVPLGIIALIIISKYEDKRQS